MRAKEGKRSPPKPNQIMSGKDAKRARRAEEETVPLAGPDGGASSLASPPAGAQAQAEAPPPAEIGLPAGGDSAMAPLLPADMRRVMEDQPGQLRREFGDQMEHELGALRRKHAFELARIENELAIMRGELSESRYEASHLRALLDWGGASTEMGMVCRRGGAGPDAYTECCSVMSVLFNVHEADLSAGFMRFFTTEEARELRLVHREFLEAVEVTPWHDLNTVISGPIAAWRTCFPSAQAANVEYRRDLTDEDCVHFRGLRALDMSGCDELLDAAFANLRGIEKLEMCDCFREDTGITANAFTHLKGVQELGMDGCDLALIAAAAEGLHGVRSFKITYSSPFDGPIERTDVSECRRLIASRCPGSSSWIYADVAFRDLPAPASAHDVIATAILELLQVGLDVGSAGIVEEATMFASKAAESDLGVNALVNLGGVQALVAALSKFLVVGGTCMNVCLALQNIAQSGTGQNACVAAGAVPPLLAVLSMHDKTYAICFALMAIANISQASAGAAACVAAGAVSAIVAAYRKGQKLANTEHCDLGEISHPFCPPPGALRSLSSIPCGAEACVAAGAVALLLELFGEGYKGAGVALRQLGAYIVGSK